LGRSRLPARRSPRAQTPYFRLLCPRSSSTCESASAPAAASSSSASCAKQALLRSPGGIQVSLLEDAADPDRFIEVVTYRDQAAFDLDQKRVESNPHMRGDLDRWRALLEGPPQVETYRTIDPTLTDA
jgi:quinol monooxygenase YgiN